MSHRVLLQHRARIPARLLLRTGIHDHVPCSPADHSSNPLRRRLPLFHLPISPIQIRCARSPRLLKSMRRDVRGDPLTGGKVVLSPETLVALRKLRFSRTESLCLQDVVHNRCALIRDIRYVYESLRNRRAWLRNDSAIPSNYSHEWHRDRGLDAILKVDIAILDKDWSDANMGRALHTIGIPYFAAGQEENRPELMAEGCFFIELGAMYGSVDAARYLINIHNDPISVEQISRSSISTDAREAKALIRDEAIKLKDMADPLIMLTYLGVEFGPDKIGIQRPDQLRWGLARLDKIPSPGVFQLRQDVTVFERCQNACEIKLQIIDHCLNRGISLAPEISQAEMMRRREEALQELATCNDPYASMVIALRPDGPKMFSEEWHRLILAAAGGGDGLALWYLGIHYMREEGVLPISANTKAKLKTSRGFEFMRLAILALHDRPFLQITIALGLAGLCRAAGDLELGFDVLLKVEEDFLERPDTEVSRGTRRTMTGHFSDWGIRDPKLEGYWDEKKCTNFMNAYLVPDHEEFRKRMDPLLRVYR